MAEGDKEADVLCNLCTERERCRQGSKPWPRCPPPKPHPTRTCFATKNPPLFSKGNLDLHILPTVAPWMLNFHDLEEEVNAKALYGCQSFPCSGQSFPSKFPFLPIIQGDQLNQVSFLFLAQGKNQRWSMWSQVLNIAIGGVAWIF